MKLNVKCYDIIAEPQGKIIEKICDATIIHMSDNRYCRYLRDTNTGGIFNATYYDESYAKVEIQLSKSIPQTELTLRDYEYMYTVFLAD